MESIVYNQSGKEVGKIALPEHVFGVKWNPDLVHQVATSLLASSRTPVAHSKGRGEVRGGGKKPWRQKGTGRARHGSIRSPIWVGGGVTHGPTNERHFFRKVNAKMKQKALASVLSAKYRDGEIMFVDDIKLSVPKSKEAKSILSSLGSISGFDKIFKKNKNAAYFFLPRKDSTAEKSFRNFGNIAVGELRNINPIDALTYKSLIFAVPEKSIEILKNKFVTNRSPRAKLGMEHGSRQPTTAESRS